MSTEPAAVTAAPRARADRSARRGLLLPVLLFLLVGSVLAVVVQSSHDHLDPEHPRTGPDISDAHWFGGWLQFDTGWYVYLAEHGYDDPQVAALDAGQQSAVAYFPGYPLVVRSVAAISGDDVLRAAQLTTAAAGLVAVVLFWVWCGLRLGRTSRRAALLLFCLYPYAWYLYGSGYGDALFVACTLGAFLLVERDRPLLGGLVGAAASATRLIGVGTGIGLIALVLQRRQAVVRTSSDEPRRWWQGWRLDRSRLRRRDAGVLVAFAGFAAYCAFLWARTGDPIAFDTVQAAPGWNQGTGPKTWIKYSFFAQVLRGDPGYGIRLVAHAALFTLFVVAVPFVWRRIGPAYAVYTGVILVIPGIGSSTFQGMGRYLLAAFPVFALGGLLLEERPRLRISVHVLSALALIVLASFFGRGYYLS